MKAIIRISDLWIAPPVAISYESVSIGSASIADAAKGRNDSSSNPAGIAVAEWKKYPAWSAARK